MSLKLIFTFSICNLLHDLHAKQTDMRRMYIFCCVNVWYSVYTVERRELMSVRFHISPSETFDVVWESVLEFLWSYIKFEGIVTLHVGILFQSFL